MPHFFTNKDGDSLKCGYTNCKLGGQVEKEVAVKVGARYFHEQCDHERQIKSEIETYYRENYNANEPMQNIRTAISNYLYKSNYDAEYVLWCLKFKNPKLNSLYGLSYTLSYKQNELDFKKWKASKVDIKFEAYEDDYMTNITKYETKPIETWGDIWQKRN